MDYLVKKGIMSKIYFNPVHLTKFYKDIFGFKDGELPITERVAREVLSLPVYPTMTIEEINYIIEKIERFFGVV
jgi:dTDP-4-amino-4,6-dideoxygalactose transaminase